MASIKDSWRSFADSKNGKMGTGKYMDYLSKKADETSLHKLPQEEMVNEMKETQAYHKKFKDTNFSYEVIHSFSPEESQTLGAKKINELGQELAKRSFFREHEYVVITHTDKAHFHNHIVVNTVHPETGKRIFRDMKYRNKLMATANEISKEHDLHTIGKTGKERNEKLHPKAKRAHQRSGQSYELDLMQKADFARAYSTDFREYTAILGEMNISLRITDKTISYLYKGKQKRKRGDKIGSRYTKEGLSEKFESNRELFNKQPELRGQILSDICGITDHKGNIVGTPGRLLLDGGGHEKFVGKNGRHRSKNAANSHSNVYPSDDHLNGSVLPVGIIRQARNASIFEYVKKHKIPTVAQKDGSIVLKGRDHVCINEYEWFNSKNKTNGSLIDFVAFHDQSSYLQAIAKITGNPRLLLLEKHFGEVKRSYSSFYIPKFKKSRKSEPETQRFFKHHGVGHDTNRELWRLQNMHVDQKGSVWFLPEDGKSGGIEYVKDDNEKWQSKKHGGFLSPFFQKAHKSRDAVIFFDPLSFIRHKQSGDILATKHGSNILVLMEKDEKQIDLFLVQNPHINRVHFSPQNGIQHSKKEVMFIELITPRYREHGIRIEKSDSGMDLTRKGPELDIGF